MHKFIKFVFTAMINIFKGCQFCLVFLALLTIIDFILSLIGIVLPEQIQIVFDTLYNFQTNIYQPDLAFFTIDLTLSIVAVELLLLAGLIVYVINFIIDFERIYDKAHNNFSQKYEKKFNNNLRQNAQFIETQNNQFVIFYDINIEKNSSDFFDNSKEIDTNEKIKEYVIMFRNYILQNIKGTYVKTEKGYLIFFEDISESDKILNKIYEFNEKAQAMAKQLRIKFFLKTAVFVANKEENYNTYLPKLEKLLSICLPNKIMTLGFFVSKYQKLSHQSFKVSDIGEYIFGDDVLNVYTLEFNPQ